MSFKIISKEKKKLAENEDKIEEEDEFDIDDEIFNEKVSLASEKKEEEEK
jgi:hypothetical protein